MSRRFTPLGAADTAALSPVCKGCLYWETDDPLEIRCGAACDPRGQQEWFTRVHEEWGECGRAVRQDDDVLGFIKYAPARYFPQARHMPAPPIDWNAPMLACMHIRDDARRLGLGKLLLQSTFKDLHLRGQRCVYSYAYSGPSKLDTVPMPGSEFLLRHGFVVDQTHPVYPLLRAELRTLAALSENLEAVLESLKIPLGRPTRAPTPSIEMRGSCHE